MAPSLHELHAVAGEKIRIKKEFLPEKSNPREVYTIIEAPAPPSFGMVVLRGNLSKNEITITSSTDALAEKVN